MEYWEFLIQREGDRGWRTIETGNLQLKEGKYRIVANSNFTDTQIQTRVTHQTPDPVPQRRSQVRIQTTNPRGLLAIIPFTYLDAGIWQFVCSSTVSTSAPWHQMLKLRILPLIPNYTPVDLIKPLQLDDRLTSAPPMRSAQGCFNSPAQNYTATKSAQIEEDDDLPAPTEPLIPISMAASENWADGLDRLLEQLERDSLRSHQPATRAKIPAKIQLKSIVDPPERLIGLDRSTFSGLVPGHHLTISGACNLHRLNPNLLQAAKIEKLLICLRHPQSSEIISSIEQALPPQLETFTFSGDLELPPELKISLLVGEVNLYDKHHIQLASCGFTVTLNLNPIQESELSLIKQFDRYQDRTAETLAQLTQELQLEIATIGYHSNRFSFREATPTSQSITPATISALNLPPDPTRPLSQSRISGFNHPDIFPVNSPPNSQSLRPGLNPPAPMLDITGDLEIDFALSSFVHSHDAHDYENLEIVVDD